MTLRAAFEPYRRLRTLAAYALAREHGGSQALAELALRHGRYLGSAETDRVVARFLETLPEAERVDLAASVERALVEAGRLRKLRASAGIFVLATGGHGDDQALILAAPSASQTLAAVSGSSVRVLLVPFAGATGMGKAWRLQAIARVGG